MRFSILYLGKMEFPAYRLVDTADEEEMIKSPAFAVLIQHPTLGNVLYDTGNHPDFEKLYLKEMLDNYPVTELITIEDALAEKGLKPSDIDMIILSHMHFDHTGNLASFIGTKAIKNVIAAEAEIKNAYYCTVTGNSGAYNKKLFDVEGINYVPVNGIVKLADDITLFEQKSHTPGVLGMILKTEDYGNVLATSDTVYTRESFENAMPPGGNINATTDEFYDNLEYLKKLKEEYDAKLLYGHDYDQAVELAARGWMK